MNDVCDVGARKGPGNIVIGIMLVVTGVVIMLDRSGALTLQNRWTVWPIILGGIGLARFLQSIPGEPKQGLLLMTAAVWLFLAEAGWVSMADSWPIVIIALGVIVALNGGRRRRRWHGPRPPQVPGERPHFRGLGRPDYPLSPLAAVGIWIAIFVGLQVSGFRSLNGESVSDRIGLVSVMGRSEHVSRATDFQGATVTNVMGRSELDLTRATLAPGATADISLFSAMGSVVLRVPPTWTVDTGAVTALGKIADDRSTLPKAEAEAVPAPRLVLRGLVLFGRVTITP